MTSVRETFDLACPECASDRELYITIDVEILLYPDGSEVITNDHLWNHRSRCCCGVCGHAATVDHFTAKPGGAQ